MTAPNLRGPYASGQLPNGTFMQDGNRLPPWTIAKIGNFALEEYKMRRVLFIGVLASGVSGQSLAQDSAKSQEDQVSHLSRGVATIEFSTASGKPWVR